MPTSTESNRISNGDSFDLHGGSKELHAFLLPFPAQGHINPMINLGKRLLSVGFTLTFLNTEPFHRLLNNAWKSSEGSKVKLLSVPDPMYGKNGKDAHHAFLNSSHLQFKDDVQDVLQPMRDEISCLIYDPLLLWIPDLADQLGIKCVAFFTSSVVLNVVMRQIPRIIQEGYIPVNEIATSRGNAPMISGIPVVSPLNAFDLPVTLHRIDPYDPGYSNRIARSKEMDKAKWVLANTLEELEGEALCASQSETQKFIPVGPLLPPKALGLQDNIDELGMVAGRWEEDDTCIKWLNTRAVSSVLYISFGSMATLGEDQVLELASGLELSQVPFLWAFRTNLVNGSSKSILDDFILRTQNVGLVVGWAPQVDVLQHPAVGGFLSHCGWNSTLESICAGVPMLGWPCWAEQPLNCNYISNVWKIGLRLFDHGIVNKTEVATKIKRLMIDDEGQKMRRRARDLGGKAILAWVDSSHRNLQAFVLAMKK